jgi:predicted anti-sigma-YlaC factor YlaD
MAGVVQLAVALPLVLGAGDSQAHLLRDLGALQLALGAGFIVAGLQPFRAGGLLPVGVVVVAVVVTGAGVDLAMGGADPVAELTHVAEIVGVAALWRLSRRDPGPSRPVGALQAAGG